VYGAFETLSDLQQQKRLLWELGNKDFSYTEAEEAGYAQQPGEDDDDYFFQVGAGAAFTHFLTALWMGLRSRTQACTQACTSFLGINS
jgi:hypothetical protein